LTRSATLVVHSFSVMLPLVLRRLTVFGCFFSGTGKGSTVAVVEAVDMVFGSSWAVPL
jgi:hypothetical protein